MCTLYTKISGKHKDKIATGAETGTASSCKCLRTHGGWCFAVWLCRCEWQSYKSVVIPHEFLNVSYPFPFCSNRFVWNIVLLVVSPCCNWSWSCWNHHRQFVAAHQGCTSQARFSAWVSRLISELHFPWDPTQKALQLKVDCVEVPGQWKRVFMVSPLLYTQLNTHGEMVKWTLTDHTCIKYE